MNITFCIGFGQCKREKERKWGEYFAVSMLIRPALSFILMFVACNQFCVCSLLGILPCQLKKDIKFKVLMIDWLQPLAHWNTTNLDSMFEVSLLFCYLECVLVQPILFLRRPLRASIMRVENLTCTNQES